MYYIYNNEKRIILMDHSCGAHRFASSVKLYKTINLYPTIMVSVSHIWKFALPFVRRFVLEVITLRNIHNLNNSYAVTLVSEVCLNIILSYCNISGLNVRRLLRAIKTRYNWGEILKILKFKLYGEIKVIKTVITPITKIKNTLHIKKFLIWIAMSCHIFVNILGSMTQNIFNLNTTEHLRNNNFEVPALF